MSDTEHKVLVKFETNTKQLQAAMGQITKQAKTLQKTTAQQTKQALSTNKQAAKIQQQIARQAKTQGPQQLTNLKKQNRELTATNRLLQTQTALWGKLKRAVGGLFGGGGGGSGGGGSGGGGGRGGSSPGFWRGLGAGLGRSPNLSRYGIGHGLGTGLRAGIGLAGGGLAALATMPFAAISSDYQAFVTYQRSMGQLSGLNRGAPFGAGYTPNMFNLKDNPNGLTHKLGKLGYMPEEVASLAGQFGRSTGSSKYTQYGATAARVLGMDAGEMSGMFGSLRLGSGQFGAAEKSQFQKMLQAAVKGGVDASTLPEYLSGVKALTDKASGSTGGVVSSLPYAQLLSVFNKSGAPGLSGARGASIAGALEHAIKAPGGGEEGQAMMLSALGFGSGKSYYQALRAQQQGFQTSEGANVVKTMFDYFDRTYGGPGEYSNLALHKVTGLNLSQIEELRGVLGDKDKFAELLKESTATELDVLKNIDKNMEEFLKQSARAAEIQIRDITRGERYAETTERIQDILHDFMDQLSPTIEKIIKVLPPVLETLTSGINELVTFFAHPAEYFSLDDERPDIEKAQKLTKQARAVIERLDRGETLSREEINRALENVREAQSLWAKVVESPGAASLIAADPALSIDAETMPAVRQRAIDRLTTALETASTRMEMFMQTRPVPATEADLGNVSEAVRALGGFVEPSPRATPSHTGGAR